MFSTISFMFTIFKIHNWPIAAACETLFGSQCGDTMRISFCGSWYDAFRKLITIIIQNNLLKIIFFLEITTQFIKCI